ncbi:MAG: DUF4493 domain-containing protein [Muribaculaceae bacterium]
MKKTIFYGVVSAMLLAGCSEDNGMITGEGEGSFYPVVNLDSEVVSADNGRAGGDVTVDDLSLRLTSADGSFMKSWTSVSDFSTDEKFKIGNYTLEAFYGSSSDEGFEKPYYYGFAELTVMENKETPVSLTASLANSMVSVTFSDNFKNYMDAFSANVTSVSGTSTYYGPNETRPVYVKPGSVQVAVTYTKPNGTTETIRPAAFNAEAKHHYRVNFDVTKTSGKAFLVITFDDTVAQDDVQIDLSQDLASAVPPSITAVGFENGVAQTFVDGVSPASNLKMEIIARAGISSVTMKTTSKSLIQQGWPSELNLVGASAEQQTILSGLGLNVKGLFRNVDQMAVIDFTEVVKNIHYIEGNTASTFEVVVNDLFGKATETLTLSLETQAVELNLSQENPLYFGSNELGVRLQFNGEDPMKNVKFAYKNERGTWTNLTVNSISLMVEEYASRAVPTLSYLVKLQVPANNSPLTIRATYNSYQTPEVAVTRDGCYLEASPLNSFAKSAAVRIFEADSKNAEAAAKAKVYVSSGSAFAEMPATVSGNLLTVSGLEANTQYTIYAVVDGIATPNVTVTTESATALQYGDMETWEVEAGLTKYWWKSYLGSKSSYWGTMNLVTTSEGGSSTSMFTHNGCAYNAISGTDKTEDKANGTYAAVIRTCGWGGNNAAASNISGCNNITVGSLHLGSSPATAQETVNYGISFASRPASLSFNYKYSPKNSADYGYAEIWVKDANGNVIASKNQNLNAIDAYTKVTLSLSYAEDCAKAAQICVIFRSSNNPACQTISTDNLNQPPFANLSDGTYMGAQLFIDDVTLNY